MKPASSWLTKKAFISVLLAFLVLVPLGFLLQLPTSLAPESQLVDFPQTIGKASFSRNAMLDRTIDPHVVFDGANYIYVTNYGNYTWLQPLNILRYTNLDGEIIIEKSVFVLQYNSTGTWLSLIDFANIGVELANDSHYILSYQLEYKEKGKKYVVGDCEIVFDLIHAGSKPKISVKVTKSGNWTTYSLGSSRWIWDIVPFIDEVTDEGWKYWVDTENNQTKELLTDTLEDYGSYHHSFLSDNSSYNEFLEWVKIDYEDVGVLCETQGGKEPYWNSRGIVVVFPEDQDEIDPSTIGTGYDVSATRNEQQRKVFRNPRGQQYYYALMEYSSGEWKLFKSSSGSSWAIEYSLSGQSSSPSIWIYEDASNSRLLIYVASVKATTSNVDVYCWKIDDGITDVYALWSEYDVGVATDDGCYNPVVSLGGNGYLWIVWADEYTNKGKQRCKVRAICSTSTYPTSGPSWSNIIDVFDKEIDANGFQMNGVPAKPSVVPLTATADVAISWSIYDKLTPTYYLSGKTGSYAGSGDPTVGTRVDFTTPAAPMMHSVVAETGANSDVFILFNKGATTIICEKWDVSANSKSDFGTLWSGYSPRTLVLSIDKTASPDKLYAFYVQVQDSSLIRYKTTGVDSASWSDEDSTDDGDETLDYFSSSYEDYNGDEKIQLIYTRQITSVVRFAELGGAAFSWTATSTSTYTDETTTEIWEIIILGDPTTTTTILDPTTTTTAYVSTTTEYTTCTTDTSTVTEETSETITVTVTQTTTGTEYETVSTITSTETLDTSITTTETEYETISTVTSTETLDTSITTSETEYETISTVTSTVTIDTTQTTCISETQTVETETSTVTIDTTQTTCISETQTVETETSTVTVDTSITTTETEYETISTVTSIETLDTSITTTETETETVETVTSTVTQDTSITTTETETETVSTITSTETIDTSITTTETEYETISTVTSIETLDTSITTTETETQTVSTVTTTETLDTSITTTDTEYTTVSTITSTETLDTSITSTETETVTETVSTITSTETIDTSVSTTETVTETVSTITSTETLDTSITTTETETETVETVTSTVTIDTTQTTCISETQTVETEISTVTVDISITTTETEIETVSTITSLVTEEVSVTVSETETQTVSTITSTVTEETTAQTTETTTITYAETTVTSTLTSVTTTTLLTSTSTIKVTVTDTSTVGNTTTTTVFQGTATTVTVTEEAGRPVNFLSVKVVDWLGSPLNNITVTACQFGSDDWSWQTRTNEDGVAVFELGADYYEVKAYVVPVVLSEKIYHRVHEEMTMRCSVFHIAVFWLNYPLLQVPVWLWIIIALVVVVVVYKSEVWKPLLTLTWKKKP